MAIFLSCYDAAMRDLSILLVHLIAHYFLARPPCGLTFCRCRVRSHQTSAPDRESLASPCTKSTRLRSADRRIVFAVDKRPSGNAQRPRRGFAALATIQHGDQNTPDNEAGRATPSPPQIRVAGWTVSGSLQYASRRGISLKAKPETGRTIS